MLDWLKGILPQHLHLHISINMPITIGSFNTRQPAAIKDDHLVIDDSTPEGQIMADKIIDGLPEHIRHNDYILDETSTESYDELDSTISTKAYQDQLQHYSPLVPKKDIPILETAILIRIKHNRGESVAREKTDIVSRYEQRGGMICNLFSAGYFDTILKPLHSEIKKLAISPSDYTATYEMIVNESPLAVFVGVGSTLQDIEKKVLKQVAVNIELDFHSLNIHGIGKANISKIRQVLRMKSVESKLADIPVETVTGKTIKVRIVF